jgi:glycerophosphoryl diester phosphodiesterase
VTPRRRQPAGPRRPGWARALGIAVIPWTVNEPSLIAKLLDMGVGGIIADRPGLDARPPSIA